MNRLFEFAIEHTDQSKPARRGVFRTPHGPIDTPAFMPVATVATVKGVDAERVRDCGTQGILANTYHLALRPGEDVINDLGGLHAFMDWPGPILTDSGGFQVFSLAHLTEVTDASARFRSHIDGAPVELSPERAIRIQEDLGSDVAMVLDHVVRLPAPRDEVEAAVERTILWARRCRDTASGDGQALFGIVQGGLDEDLRGRCAAKLVSLDFDGYAVGGLSVGEPPEKMYRVLDFTVPQLPAARPRYLMGVGRPQDILEAVGRGIDLFDCVMPTRNGRNALAFTDQGTLRLRNLRYGRDPRPLEPDCPCPACRHSRGYLRHLFQSREMLGPVLVSLHNLTYYQRLMADIRQAIRADRFDWFARQKLRQWRTGGGGVSTADGSTGEN